MSDLPPGLTIYKPPPELRLSGGYDAGDADYYWERSRAASERNGLSAIQAMREFPERALVEGPAELRAKQFACSGGVGSRRYAEATQYRAMPDMGWEQARVALNRLYVPIPYDRRGPLGQFVALAEFALTATGFEFDGRRGDHAVKLREELGQATGALRRRLGGALHEAERNTGRLAGAITTHGDVRGSSDINGAVMATVCALWSVVPAAADEWVPIHQATPEQAIASLDYLRATLAIWEDRRPIAANVAERLDRHDPKVPADDMPTAEEYAESIHIADMLVFVSEKLLSLYAGIMHSMPIYRMYPATSEPEAISLWWPWGRPTPMIDGAPPKPPKPRKFVLDPAIITSTRPQDIVREVMEKTGINRTTAQRLTAARRASMRSGRRSEAERLLRQGRTKAEVARATGLSPSRISALFPGKNR